MARNRPLIRCLSMIETLKRSRCTIEQLAIAFAVTTRTVRRDLNALQDAGVPVTRHGDIGDPGLWWICSTTQGGSDGRFGHCRPGEPAGGGVRTFDS